MLHVGQNTIANLKIFFCILATSMCNNTCSLSELLLLSLSVCRSMLCKFERIRSCGVAVVIFRKTTQM